MKPETRSRKLAAALLLLVAWSVAQPTYAQRANDDSFTVLPGSIDNELDVLANDDTRRNASLFSVTTPDRGGQVRIDSERRFLIYTPPAGFEGVENFSYVIVNRRFQFSTADVRVLVEGSNSPPVAEDDAYSTERERDLAVSASNGVLANDSDPDGDGLTTLLLAGPSNGKLTLNANGAFTYEPERNFVGEDSFSYRANDGRALSQPALVRISVGDRNEPPMVDDIPDQLGSVGVAFVLDLTPFVSDSDGPSPLQFEAVSLPSGLTLSPEGVVSGFPTTASLGTGTTRFRVSDGVDTVEDAFKITIRDERVTDLRVTLSAAPNPLRVGSAASWSVTVINESNYRVDAATVDGRLTGEVPFSFDTPSDPGCSITTDGDDTRFSCQIRSLDAGETATIELSGSSSRAGDIVGSVVAATAVALDSDPDDNDAQASLSVAESISDAPAQSLGDVEALAIASGDIDGDGKDDLVVATAASAPVLLYLNVVDPSNERKRMLATSPTRLGAAVRDNGVAVGDLDGDLDLDIVAAGSASAFPRVYLNDGGGQFRMILLDQLGHDASAVRIGDFDADGFADLALSGRTEAIVYFGTGVPGAFSSPLALAGSSSVDLAAADFSGGGRDELVLARPDGDASIYRFVGRSPVLDSSLSTGATTSVAAGDFDGDGSVDLVFGKASSTGATELPSNPVFLNGSLSGSGFTLAEALGAAPTFAVLGAEVDDSGSADAIVLNETGAHQVFLSASAGGILVRASDQLSVAGATGATLGSFSADDRPDIAIGTRTGVRVFRSDGARRFGTGDMTPPTIALIGASPVQTTVGQPYVDLGATATDSDDGDLTTRIEVSSTVDANVIGTYMVTYQVWDDSGNASNLLTRSVEVKPNAPQGGGGGGAIDLLSLLLLLLSIPGLRAISRVWPRASVDGIMAPASDP